MNEDRKRRGLSSNKILTAAAICSLLLGSGNLMATNSEAASLGVQEQMQNITVTVKVTDAKGEPIIGANVIQKGTANGSITDFSGIAKLSVPRDASLFISFVGYRTQEVKVTSSQMDIVLKEDAEIMDEVVVVGYGTQKRANLTGAVSTVDVAKTMEARPQGDVAKALQGVVPGLTVLSSSGKLDESPVLTIRGTGTLSNGATSNPMIIVDGIQMDDALSTLNPEDIESISVLKDAASTSIYGARAAFGVILITTKSAKKMDKVVVNYTNNFAWASPTVLPNYPDVATQAWGLRRANERAGLANELFGMYMDDEFIAKAEAWKERHGGKAGYREMIPGDDFDLDPETGVGLYYADWDMVGIMFRDWKPAQKHNISVQGTSGKTSYYLSFGYNKEEGVMTFNPDKLKRYNVTMNVTSDVTKWLQVGGRFSYNDRNYTEPNTRRASYVYMWRWGSYFGPYGTYNGYDMENDIAYRMQAGDKVTQNTYTRIGGFVKAKLLKGLTLNADYTVNIQNRDYYAEGKDIYNLYSWGYDVRTPGWGGFATYLEQQSNKDQSYALNVYANYELDLAKDHHFNFMVGANAEEGERRWHYSKRTDLLDQTLPEFPLATGDQTVDGGHSEWGTAGWFGRINYDWKGIWLLELNGRYDGSSSFPASDRWAFFPSGSMGYRFSEEKYFEPLRSVISNGKLRGSFGEIGNEAIGPNMFISTISGGTVNWLNNSGIKLSNYNMPSLVSSTLMWERIQTLDLGLDLGFLNGDLNVTFDWYQRTTKDMLAPAKTMPQVLGASAPYVNAGELRTRGWELNLDWHHTFTNLDNLNVYANFNLGDYQTVITKWDNDAKLLNQNYSGKTYGDIWGFETEGLFKDEADVQSHADQSALESGTFVYGAGDIKFKDLNKDGVINGGAGTEDDHGDLKVIGNTTPRYQYAFRLGGNWKGFDIDMFFQGVGKRDIWSTSAFVLPLSRGADAVYANQTDYWNEENRDVNAFYPRMYPGNGSQGNISVINGGKNNFYPQTRYLIDASYLRFKNLTVGYTLPKNWLDKAHIDKVRVYFSAENLCELINNSYAPIDPEVNTGQNGSTSNGTWGRVEPMYRTVSFGLQVSF